MLCDLCERHFYMDKHMECIEKPLGVKLTSDR